MVSCADKAYKTADARLNETWRKTVGVVRKANNEMGGDADLVQKLRKAQRAWIALRDAQCTFESAQMFGGTMAPVLEIGCQTDLTKRRTRTLQRIAKDFSQN